jgi:Seven in absentia protein family
LLCDLRCPGCTIRLQSPIYLCASGHSLCRLCHISLTACPICSKEMTDMRSYTLERLSQKFQFPCKNLRNGCNVRLPMELMKWHEEKCIYKKTSCFMGKVWHDCVWIGKENEWLQHCKEKHSHKILQRQDVYELMWNYETLKDNAGPILTYYLIENFNETFNLYQIHEAKHGNTFINLFIIHLT